MPLDLTTCRSELISHAQKLGHFEQVLGHEPLSAPTAGLTYAVWVADVAPVPARSGLNSVSVRLEMAGRVLHRADSFPQDDIDVTVTAAVDALMGAYCGDFELGGAVANVDLLGAHGASLRTRFGFTRLDTTTYRVAALTIPLILNDVWTEAP